MVVVRSKVSILISFQFPLSFYFFLEQKPFLKICYEEGNQIVVGVLFKKKGIEYFYNFYMFVIVLTETSMHYKMRRHGFREDSIWQASSSRQNLPPFAVRASESRVGVLPIGLGFLRQFKHPTIFLKISCDGDYLLPLIVGMLHYFYLLFSLLPPNFPPRR